MVPVILCGGVGTRLWPLSRKMLPKQLLPLASNLSMLQETIKRVSGDAFSDPWFVTGAEHRFLVAEQARQLGMAGKALLEPVGRNTAPAAAIAALVQSRSDAKGLLLILPADHVVNDLAAFEAALQSAIPAARAGKLVTFGIEPTHPATGYGWIEGGPLIREGVRSVARFVEKPNADNAQSMLSQGGFYWNAGIFLFSAEAFLAELEEHQPELLEACKRSLEAGREDSDFIWLDEEAFTACPSDSIDYAVMEKTTKAAVVPVQMGWNDVGAWSALWDIGTKDERNNVNIGDVVSVNTEGSYLRSEGPLVAAVGLKDLVVVATKDVVLVADRSQSQEVKQITVALKEQDRSEVDWHPTVYRPWGNYTGVDADDGFQVKRIVVKPGAKLSLQKHAHRSEHWVVVRGTALVTRGDELVKLSAGQYTFIELGMVHRLENIGERDLILVEVQCGDYLGEDDIVRLEDTYGRA